MLLGIGDNLSVAKDLIPRGELQLLKPSVIVSGCPKLTKDQA